MTLDFHFTDLEMARCRGDTAQIRSIEGVTTATLDNLIINGHASAVRVRDERNRQHVIRMECSHELAKAIESLRRAGAK